MIEESEFCWKCGCKFDRGKHNNIFKSDHSFVVAVRAIDYNESFDAFTSEIDRLSKELKKQREMNSKIGKYAMKLEAENKK